MAARNLLAARGVRPSIQALAGAWDEVEHRNLVAALIHGLANAGKK